MRYSKEHKGEQRQKVLAEAAKAIRSVGPAGISLSGVMGRAGLTNGAFYCHFSSKDDLVSQAVGEMFRDPYERWLAGAQAADPAALLAQFLKHYLSLEHVREPERGCPIPTLGGVLPQLTEEGRREAGLGVGMAVNGLADVLDRLGAPDPASSARALIPELVGAVTIARILDDVEAPKVLSATRGSIDAKLAALLPGGWPAR